MNVLCLGDSVHRYELDGCQTIGVNDVNKFFPDTPVDYLVCVDSPEKFTPARRHTIERGWCKKFFTPLDEWKHHFRFSKITFVHGRSVMKEFDNPDKVCYSNNSAFVAVVMAYKLGAKEIYLYGADFVDHHAFRGPSFKRMMDDFRTLHKLLEDRGVKLFVTKESMLAVFIPSF